MAFNFSLAAVLALRQQLAQREETVLAAVLQQLAAARDTLRRIEDERTRVLAELSKTGPERLQAVSLHERYARLHVLEAGRAEMHAQVTDLERRRDTQQALYLAARRDRDLLDELRTRQHAAHTLEASRREAKQLDDLFLARRLRS